MFRATKRFDPLEIPVSKDEGDSEVKNGKRKLSERLEGNNGLQDDDRDDSDDSERRDQSEVDESLPDKPENTRPEDFSDLSISSDEEADAIEDESEGHVMKDKEADVANAHIDSITASPSKHSRILERYKKAASKLPLSAYGGDISPGSSKPIAKAAGHSIDLEFPAPPPPSATIPRLPPKWLTEPTIVGEEAVNAFEDLGICDRLLANIKQLGYTDTFPVQTAVLTQMLKEDQSIAPGRRKDILVNAPTGSGKTLGYAVPIIQALHSRVVPRVRALVLIPTKPLVQQVRSVFESLVKGTGLVVTTLRADRPFKQEQALLETNPPDIVITTPGRAVDHLQQNTAGFDLQHLQYLVVDEADRLLNQSFQNWADIVLKSFELPENALSTSDLWYRPVQKLVFSATLTRDPGKLADLHIHDPQLYLVGSADDTSNGTEFAIPPTLTEIVTRIKSISIKPLRMAQLLYNNNITANTIIFVNSNESAARLAVLADSLYRRLYSRSLIFRACSGEQEVSTRKKTLRDFALGSIDVLICTDLIARGIDIASVQHVINYDIPVSRRDYVHRVGRTARAGSTGTAWSIVADSAQHKQFWGISRRISRTGNVQVIHMDEDIPSEVMEIYQDALKDLQTKTERKRST